MSFSYRTYVGPYARCKVGTVAVTRERRTCTNPTCPWPKDEASDTIVFCSRCGSPTGSVLFTEQAAAIDAWDVLEAIDERLSPTEGAGYLCWVEAERAHLWLANARVLAREPWLKNRRNFACIEIMPDQIHAERTAFEAHFAKELSTLREMYGPNAVSIHWGIIQDYC